MKTADAYPNYNAMSVKKSDLESNLMYTNSRKNYSSKYKLKIKASWLNELSIQIKKRFFSPIRQIRRKNIIQQTYKKQQSDENDLN